MSVKLTMILHKDGKKILSFSSKIFYLNIYKIKIKFHCPNLNYYDSLITFHNILFEKLNYRCPRYGDV